MKRLIIHIYGHVQGVFFRYNTRKLARKLGLTGIVQNCPDGSVYVEAEGQEENLLELLKFCKHGPEAARVDHVEFEYKPVQFKYKGFDYSF